MKKIILALSAFVALTGMKGEIGPEGAFMLFRLDCGAFRDASVASFSDTNNFDGVRKTLVNSCYLIKNGSRYMVWDTGIPADTVQKPVRGGDFPMELSSTMVDQLKRIGVSPDQIEFVGVSHDHFDHIGQADSFPKATLLIGAEDHEAIKSNPELGARFKPWIEGGAKVDPVKGDKDVFGDGRVLMLNMPGHTPGHHSLLVKLASGPVLLTGDLFHFTEQMEARSIPSFNANRADTLASFDRFLKIGQNLKAKIIIQHEEDDVAKLPTFPQGAQ